jgi:hypothetical protein
LVAAELYDHTADPSTSWGDYENVNLATDAAHSGVVATLSAKLKDRWAKPQPPPVRRVSQE